MPEGGHNAKHAKSTPFSFRAVSGRHPETLKDVQYNKWREYDPEDTIRFYSLRLRDAGMIKSTPNKVIAGGADWRFLNELKRELKV